MQEKKTTKNLRIRKVCIVGVIPSFAFQRAKHCALELHRKLPQRFPLPEIVGLLELDWSEKLQEWRQMLGREYWCLRRPVAVFFDNRFIGSDIELIKLTTISNILLDNIPRKDMSCLKQNFRKDYISYLKNTKRIYCYLDICVDDVYAGTLTFRLYSDLLPRTCENFKTLCLGNRGPLLSYKGSRIHRIVKKGWLQGGDIQYKTGGGGFSIFCDPLEDESFGISHDRRGVLSMANAGRHKNGSQFFITLQPSKWMDSHFVAFGQLIEGVKVLKKLENLETFYETPLSKVEIKNCGKLDLADVEDIDVLYKEERMPMKKHKKIERISQQIIRQIMEALTAALERKVHPADILDEGDIPSKMNLQLYFQGFYSLPRSILEKSAAYLRNLRRELFRLMKPSATEVVESLMYDLQIAVFTRMTNLDDMRETIGREMYNKMIAGIGMTLEGCRKGYLKRFIDQVVATAENMVSLVTKKLLVMKERSKNLKKFQERMENWVRSFVLQETYEGDNYFIAERPVVFKDEKKVYEGKVCCEEEKKRKEKQLIAKMKEKYAPDDFCCLGSQMHFSDSQIYLSDLFSTCRYDLKKIGEPMERMPLLDLIEINRFKLRWIRTGQRQKRTDEMICTEKKIRKWMEEVVYTPETSWLKDAVFPRDCRVLDHVEEIMYGAMTAGLLEMYFFMDEYIRVCGGRRRQKLVTRTIYPEDLSGEGTDTSSSWGGHGRGRGRGRDGGGVGAIGGEDWEEWDTQGWRRRKHGKGWGDNEDGTGKHGKRGDGTDGTDGTDGKTKKGQTDVPPGFELVPCPCGHPCCDCEFDPNQRLREKQLTSGTEKGKKGTDGEEDEGDGKDGKDGKGGRGKGKGKGEGKGKGKGKGKGGRRGKDGEEDGEGKWEEEEGEGEDDGEGMGDKKRRREEISSDEIEKPCESDETMVDLNVILAQKLSKTPEEVDINSFRWLKPYIMEKGCDLKTKFATRVHEWIDGERFNTQGLISKHSLVSRASLLSLSLSLADLIKEDNNLKTEIKDFVYDLWSLYFQEMFKEALLEYPPKEEEGEMEFRGEGEEDYDSKGDLKGKAKGKAKGKGKGKGKGRGRGKGKGRSKDKGKGRDVGEIIVEGVGGGKVWSKGWGKSWSKGWVKSWSKVGGKAGGKTGGKGEGKGWDKRDGKSRGKRAARKGKRPVKDGDESDDEDESDDDEYETEGDSEVKGGREGHAQDKRKKKKKKKKDLKCKKLMELFKDFDFDSYCKKLREEQGEVYPDSELPYDDQMGQQGRSPKGIQQKSASGVGVRPSVHYQSSDGQQSGKTQGTRGHSSTTGQSSQSHPSVVSQSAGSQHLSTHASASSVRPSVQAEPGSARPSVQIEPGSARPSVQVEPGSARPSVQVEPGSARPSVQVGPGSARPSVQVGPGSARPSVQVGPRSARPSVQVGPGSARPSVQVGPRSVRPSVQFGNDAGPSSDQDDWTDEEGYQSSEMYEQSPSYEDVASDFETRKRRKSKSWSLEGSMRKRKSPIVIQELVEEPSDQEIRVMPPYVPPFWVKFLTETTKQALGAFSKMSRLPQRLYLKTDSQMAFEEKMKDWFEFNAFNPQPTKGREVMDYIALHHKPLTNLEDTARSFMKKKKFAGLLNRCTRFSSADSVVGDIIIDALKMSQLSSGLMIEEETVELFVSDVISSAAVSRGKSDYSEYGEYEADLIQTDEREPSIPEMETEEN